MMMTINNITYFNNDRGTKKALHIKKSVDPRNFCIFSRLLLNVLRKHELLEIFAFTFIDKTESTILEAFLRQNLIMLLNSVTFHRMEPVQNQ